MKGTIFDIQRFAVHDGQGIRTIVFLKGCPLHCDWCSNPESQHSHPQLMYDQTKCISCGQCQKNCTFDAIRLEPAYGIDTQLCKDCPTYSCVKQCYSRALTIAGKRYTADEIVELVRRDSVFYGSTGGVTISGGEAVFQIEFLVELLQKCKQANFNIAMETCSACTWETMQRTMPYIDTYLCDVKHTDAEKLKRETGGDAELILGNIRRLAQNGMHVVARIPLIPGFNTAVEEVRKIGQFLALCGIQEVEVLNFHKLGVPKYEKCFAGRQPKERTALAPDEVEQRISLLQSFDLKVSHE